MRFQARRRALSQAVQLWRQVQGSPVAAGPTRAKWQNRLHHDWVWLAALKAQRLDSVLLLRVWQQLDLSPKLRDFRALRFAQVVDFGFARVLNWQEIGQRLQRQSFSFL